MLKKTVKILVIDDEEDFSFFLKKNLARLDYKVLVASNGRKGLQLARRHKPDLILLDVMMPGIDGFEVLKSLKTGKETLSIPVIMLTGRDDQEAKQLAASLYNEDYIVKPANVEELRLRIEKVLDQRRGQED
ncbi:MAG: response regulator [Candidatus Omnitrophica bacterium]|nr:response regulator [Candidatus Omnitrophota bacterium]